MDLPSDSNEIIKKASKSFYFASLLLPKHLRPDVVDLYAFMRYCDDCIDDGDLALNQKKNFLTQMAPKTQLANTGFPLNRRIVDNFTQLSKKFSFPDRIVELFVEGLYWDLENRTYYSLEDLIEYCIRVAATVGVFMCYMMQTTDSRTLYHACCLGVGMQLSNIARDVGEDLQRGRMYLPTSWLTPGLRSKIKSKAPLSKDSLSGEDKQNIASSISQLLVVADEYYATANIGISYLPSECQQAIRTASRIYQEIGSEVRKNQCQSLERRVYVSLWKKVWLFFQVLFVIALSWLFGVRDRDVTKAPQGSSRVRSSVNFVLGLDKTPSA